VEIRGENLDWLPAVLAALDMPFVIERPDELRDRVVALADRLATSGRKLSCWHSLTRGDGEAFAMQARAGADLREFGVCAGLLADP
jgi:hypothetical protein